MKYHVQLRANIDLSTAAVLNLFWTLAPCGAIQPPVGSVLQ